MEYHEVTNIFPMMSDVEFEALVADIKTNGLIEPIWTYREKIIDGRNRFKACKAAGAEPKFKEWNGNGSLVGFVVSLNLKRRHLNESQKAFVAVDILPMLEAEAKARMSAGGGDKKSGSQKVDTPIQDQGRASEHAARIVGTNRQYVHDAKAIAAKAPDKAEAIRKGEKTISEVKKEFNREQRQNREHEELKAATGQSAVIIQGDCLHVLNRIDPIDLLITDPPYFTDGDFTGHISACLSMVKRTGQAYVFASADPEELSAYLTMDRRGMTLEQVLIWNYNNTGQRQPKDRYNSNYQVVFYFRGPEAAPINKPSDGTHQYACQTVNAPDGRLGDRYHEWQKPMELVERYIRNSSNECDFVFDPFAGTGTMILAAAKLGRKAIGCDIDPKAIEICLKRGCVHDI